MQLLSLKQMPKNEPPDLGGLFLDFKVGIYLPVHFDGGLVLPIPVYLHCIRRFCLG